MIKEIVKARKHGIRMPIRAWKEAKRAGLPFHIACAFLVQETNGGQNIFGHDPTIFVGAGKVTKKKYLAYKKKRGSLGQGGMQGVGPMQLTYWTIQDTADQLGGCWKPSINMRVGFTLIVQYEKALGSWTKAAERYNGSREYAVEVRSRWVSWKKILP